MRRFLLFLALPLATIPVWAAPPQASPTVIPILNPHFDMDELPCSPGYDCYGNAGITGWVCGPQTSIQKMSKAQYPKAPTSGLTVASIGNTTGSGSVMQTLGATVQANTTYTLLISVGARADFAFTGYNAALMAGNVVLVSGNKATPVGGSFVPEVLVYNSGATPLQVGQPLQIFVASKGNGEMNLSAVTLTADPSGN